MGLKCVNTSEWQSPNRNEQKNDACTNQNASEVWKVKRFAMVFICLFLNKILDMILFPALPIGATKEGFMNNI